MILIFVNGVSLLIISHGIFFRAHNFTFNNLLLKLCLRQADKRLRGIFAIDRHRRFAPFCIPRCSPFFPFDPPFSAQPFSILLQLFSNIEKSAARCTRLNRLHCDGSSFSLGITTVRHGIINKKKEGRKEGKRSRVTYCLELIYKILHDIVLMTRER